MFLGEAKWRVEAVENSSTLQVGDMFECRTFVVGHFEQVFSNELFHMFERVLIVLKVLRIIFQGLFKKMKAANNVTC